MITLEKIRLFEKYDGDGDLFIRCATLGEKSIMNYDDWQYLNNVIQDLIINHNNLSSKEYNDKTFEQMNLNCENVETKEALLELIGAICQK